MQAALKTEMEYVEARTEKGGVKFYATAIPPSRRDLLTLALLLSAALPLLVFAAIFLVPSSDILQATTFFFGTLLWPLGAFSLATTYSRRARFLAQAFDLSLSLESVTNATFRNSVSREARKYVELPEPIPGSQDWLPASVAREEQQQRETYALYALHVLLELASVYRTLATYTRDYRLADRLSTASTKSQEVAYGGPAS